MTTVTAQVSSSVDAVEQTVAALGSMVVRPESHPDPLAEVVAKVDQFNNFENALAPLVFLGQARDLFFGLGHLQALKSHPVVFHVTVTDFGYIAALRSAGIPIVQSFGPEDAPDMAVVADAVARLTKRPVIHVFTNELRSAPFQWSPELIGAAIATVTDQTFAAEEARAESHEDLTVEQALEQAFSIARQNSAFEYRGSPKATKAIVVLGEVTQLAEAVAMQSDIGLLAVRVLAPFDANKLLEALPPTVTEISVLEQVVAPTTALLPLFQDLFGADAEHLAKLTNIKSFQLGRINDSSDVLNRAFGDDGAKNIIGEPFAAGTDAPALTAEDVERFQGTDDVYLKVLSQMFPHLVILNNELTQENSTSPEFAFGKYLAAEEQKQSVLKKAVEDVKTGKISGDEAKVVSQWAVSPTDAKLVSQLPSGLQQQFNAEQWIVGSDEWAYDWGMSGVHHVLGSKKNVNMLVIESAANATQKKDIGLYAMTFGNVYAASVAVYASYSQLLQALLEAQAFDGPSVVVAYLPKGNDAIDVLKQTKRAVESGFWPLYRYNGQDIQLDSYVLKQSLQDFLARDQKLTLLANQKPELARTLAQSQGSLVRSQQKERAQKAYAQLLEGLSGPPVLVLYASDGGQAENVAKRLARRAKARGLKARVAAFDDYEAEELANEPTVVFITSTAGQGEFPQNGRQLWEQLKNATVDFGAVRTAVFGMGDSEYWPRKQDKHYYNKPSNDLAKRLNVLGAQTLVELGQGDDQDVDGWSTGYNAWEPLVWKALGVDHVDGGDEPPPLTNEDMKRDSNYLRGTIAEELLDKSTGSINAVNQQLTKFHGIYMQDDRDIRDERKQQGLEPAYAFMVRVRLPGCRANPAQWLAIDRLSDERGNGTFKITTRATFQLHGVIKEDLKPAIRGMNSVLLDTVAACGDVDRNVVTASSVQSANVRAEVAEFGKQLSEHLLPRTTAYYEIWLEGEDPSDGPDYQKAVNSRTEGPVKKANKHLVAQSAPVLAEGAPDEEPLYKALYLPRKFKINIAVPPYNDVDVYGHDIGLIAIVENNSVVGFNVLVGGGMGTTHNNKKTYPRTGSLIGYTPKEKVLEVCEKVMLVQRDNGDRKNRKHARLKYTVDDMTVEGFKAEVEKYLGYALAPAREHPQFTTNVDTYGWIRDEEGLNHFTTFVENGRVEDTPELQHRSGFREIAHAMQAYAAKNPTSPAEFKLTANQHIIVSGITDEFKADVDALLVKWKLDNVVFSGLRLSSAACVAFPTCGLAMAESERYLPILVSKLEGALEEYGLRHDSVVMRMTGCPNGCARPWLAEVALVGKAYGAYNLMLGGGHVGQRLNKLYRSSLKEDEILSTLKPMFKAWALERQEGEPFGDFVIRKGIIKATRQGLDWWDDVEPGLE